MLSRDDIVEEARTWIDAPWAHQGRTRAGIDCAGLVAAVAQSLGLADVSDLPNYQRRTHGTDFLKPFFKYMDRKPLLEVLPGDVILFRDNSYPCHSSIFAQRWMQPTIIHAHAQRRKVVEEIYVQGDWVKKAVACFAFRGVS